MIVDTHCHLNSQDYNNLEEIINNMKNNIIIVSSSSPDDINQIINLIETHKNIYGTIGIHPEFANTYTKKDLENLEKHLTHPKIVGIGEIGLDYHYTKENKQKQKDLLIKQINLANKYNKTIVIHTRDAIEDTYNIINKYKNKNINCNIHCFTQNLQWAKKLTDQNICLGIGGILTFKNEKQLKQVVKQIDLKHLIIETDSPYLSPEPLRGRQNQPANTIYIAKAIANIKNIPLSTVEQITTKTALSQFDIKL